MEHAPGTNLSENNWLWHIMKVSEDLERSVLMCSYHNHHHQALMVILLHKSRSLIFSIGSFGDLLLCHRGKLSMLFPFGLPLPLFPIYLSCCCDAFKPSSSHYKSNECCLMCTETTDKQNWTKVNLLYLHGITRVPKYWRKLSATVDVRQRCWQQQQQIVHDATHSPSECCY